MSRHNLHGPGLVLPSGALSKPLIDYLTEGAGQAAPIIASITALDGRVTVLESGEFHWNGHGANGITVSGSADEGYTFTWAGTTSNVPEGTRLYFTDARARTAVIAATITDGDTTHSPSGDAVFDAIAVINAAIAAIPTGVPTLMAANYTVAANIQALFTLPIEVGTYDLDIAGDLVEVA